MIEGAPGGAEVAKPAPVAPARRIGDLLHGIRGGLARWLLPSQREADIFLWNLRVAHRVLWLVLTALGVYVVADLMVVSRPVARSTVTAAAPDAQPASAEVGAPLRGLSQYLVAVKERNPFTGESGQQGPAHGKTTKRKLEELAEGLVVVGIDRGANPVALVEHPAQHRTFMVKVGDEINRMKVTKVGADGVTVSYEGETLTLP